MRSFNCHKLNILYVSVQVLISVLKYSRGLCWCWGFGFQFREGMVGSSYPGILLFPISSFFNNFFYLLCVIMWSSTDSWCVIYHVKVVRFCVLMCDVGRIWSCKSWKKECMFGGSIETSMYSQSSIPSLLKVAFRSYFSFDNPGALLGFKIEKEASWRKVRVGISEIYSWRIKVIQDGLEWSLALDLKYWNFWDDVFSYELKIESKSGGWVDWRLPNLFHVQVFRKLAGLGIQLFEPIP